MTTKTLIYKVARFNKEINGKNLQDFLVLALNKKKNAISRRQPTESENHFRLINYHGSFKGLKVGDFFDYTYGQKQPLAKLEEEVEELKISTLSAPDKFAEIS